MVSVSGTLFHLPSFIHFLSNKQDSRSVGIIQYAFVLPPADNMTSSLLQVSVIVPVLFFLLPFLAVLRSIIRALSSPLRSLPGPFWARFTRLWYLSKVWAGDFQKTNIELHEVYGNEFFLDLHTVTRLWRRYADGHSLPLY
jgi:hypothetical protein